ncbi:hypothetical protein SGPA1_41259 [Streptomyces misionensis JCM 4497]
MPSPSTPPTARSSSGAPRSLRGPSPRSPADAQEPGEEPGDRRIPGGRCQADRHAMTDAALHLGRAVSAGAGGRRPRVRPAGRRPGPGQARDG